MLEPTQWTRNQQTTDNSSPVRDNSRDYKAIVSLILLIIGTLVLVTGVLFQFGLPVALIVFGLLMVVVGFALGFKE